MICFQLKITTIVMAIKYAFSFFYILCDLLYVIQTYTTTLENMCIKFIHAFKYSTIESIFISELTYHDSFFPCPLMFFSIHQIYMKDKFCIFRLSPQYSSEGLAKSPYSTEENGNGEFPLPAFDTDEHMLVVNSFSTPMY